MAGAEHIGLPGLQRFEIAAAHQGLGGQVKHHLRLEGIQALAEAIQIGQIGPLIAPQQGGNPQRLVETGPAPITRIQAIALHLRAPVQEPKGEPAALEARMATQPNAAAPPELRRSRGEARCTWGAHGVGGTHHVFQGARPCCQSSSSSCLSRRVSIGCQKPWC